MIHRYTDMNAPIISDFANVYHDPITISFLQSIVSCQLCLRNRSGKPSRHKPASQHVFAVIERAEEKNLSRSPLLNFSTGF